MAGRLSDIGYAKLNLALHVRRRREDGYHDLETLFAFVDDGDRLIATPADDLSLTVDGPFGDDIGPVADNLVLRSLAILQERAGVTAGAKLSLTKRLPVASGVGGGSADAAAALRMAARLWGIAADDPLLAEVALLCGADIPACLASQAAFGCGIGEKLTPTTVSGVSGAAVLLVNPLIACPTGPVFAAWDKIDRGPLDPADWRRGRNDLQEPAIAICPEINEVLTVLKAQLPSVARMSGSGATCFALFENVELRDAAARRIAGDHRDWWMMSGTLR